jgi:membrane-bound ClpP family serine protease
MTESSKDYLLKTIVAIILIAVGVWGIYIGGQTNVILGSICFLIGFIIMLALYGGKWLWWWFR